MLGSRNGSGRANDYCLYFRLICFISLSIYKYRAKLEHMAGFEPAIGRFCRPLVLTTRPHVHILQGEFTLLLVPATNPHSWFMPYLAIPRSGSAVTLLLAKHFSLPFRKCFFCGADGIRTRNSLPHILRGFSIFKATTPFCTPGRIRTPTETSVVFCALHYTTRAFLWPQCESNAYLRHRKPTFYPLNHGTIVDMSGFEPEKTHFSGVRTP